jgi:hypothetical protein
MKVGDSITFVEDERGRFSLEVRTYRLADLRGIVRPPGEIKISEWVRDARSDRADKAIPPTRRPSR